MAHVAWKSRSSGVGSNDPSSTQLVASSRLNVIESIGDIASDGGTSPGVKGAQLTSDKTSPDIASGDEPLKVRKKLSDVEADHLERTQTDPYQRKLKFSRLFGDHVDRLKEWPKFFKTIEKSGIELRDGFVTQWTTFIVAESLLAGVAIQPFVTNIPGLSGWQFEVYGLVWSLALIFDYIGFTVTALFLGFLHATPAKLTYFWLCNLGAWVGVPSVLVLLGALSSLFAIAYSSWVIYGHRVGIVSASVGWAIVIFAVVASNVLRKCSTATSALS